jgi:chromate transport protein ChrA
MPRLSLLQNLYRSRELQDIAHLAFNAEPGGGTGKIGGIFGPFLRLGLTAFGGSAAHLVLMQLEFVGDVSRLPTSRSWTWWALAVVSAGLLIRFRVNATWLILCGAGIGPLVKLLF